jgi:phosphoribosyl-ATP pyrophosphohydrolase/phosphoribosyl-AMP cyclohydrolase
MSSDPLTTLDWDKVHGLVPAIIQDAHSLRVLMLGYMNAQALAQTQATGRVTFFSRSRQCLWTKGETSGHYLKLVDIQVDCDQDTLLIMAEPAGPVCHTGDLDCFQGKALHATDRFISQLQSIIDTRLSETPPTSYTATLAHQGMARMAQKVGEEGLEVALAAVTTDNTALLSESADLIYHLLVLLRARQLQWTQVVDALEARHQARLTSQSRPTKFAWLNVPRLNEAQDTPQRLGGPP